MLSIYLKTPKDIQMDTAKRFQTQRLYKNVSRRSLSELSGVPAVSIARFETMGEISLKSLIMISQSLGSTDEFEELFPLPLARSLDEIEAQGKLLSTKRRKGRK